MVCATLLLEEYIYTELNSRKSSTRNDIEVVEYSALGLTLTFSHLAVSSCHTTMVRRVLRCRQKVDIKNIRMVRHKTQQVVVDIQSIFRADCIAQQ